MKWIASLIILSLLVTSLKLLPAVNAFSGLVLQSEVKSSCCSSKTACETKSDLNVESPADSSDHEDEKDCCTDGDCHCLCCLHVVYCKNIEFDSFSEDTFDESQYNWKFDYFKDFNYSIFHPPLV